MNRIIMTAGLALILAATPAMAQMMNPGQHMTQQQAMHQQQAAMQQQQQGTQQQQYYNPYQMNPAMMGGYGMHPNMMGGWGHHGMHQMMGGYGMPPCTGLQGPYKTNEEYTKFLDDTREERRKLHSLMFDYGESMRSPEPDKEKLQEMEKEIFELRDKISTYKTK